MYKEERRRGVYFLDTVSWRHKNLKKTGIRKR